MKKIVRNSLTLLAFATGLSAFGQVTVGPEGTYLIGDYCHVGIDKNGHEGTHEMAGVTPYVRTTYWGADSRFGFVANPELTLPWGTGYDGDFFTPGSPENGFGISVAGANYTNNATLVANIAMSLTTTTYEDGCMTAEYDGTVASTGLEMGIKYHLVESNLYYTTEVTITNASGATITDIYYGRNVDPDNNVAAGGTYVTTNTVVAQPSASCEKAIVTAESNSPASNPSFMGFGAIGENFRVGHGGFNNDDAEDMWTGVVSSGWGTFYTSEGDVRTADEAIFLSYHIDALAPGESETFKFVVILDETQVETALSDLYSFTSPALVSGSSTCIPTEDTVETCPGVGVEITFDGPLIIDYAWTWSPPTDLSTFIGTTTTASPSTTTTYTITGTPINPCYTEPVTKTVVVDMLPGPIIDFTDPGPQCSDFLLSDLVLADVSGLGGTIITEFYSVEPDSIDDPDDMWPSTVIAPYEEPIVMMGNTDNGCFTTDTITLDWSGASEAGADSTEAMCNFGGSTLDLTTYVSAFADPGGTWEETTGTPSGSFDPATGVFNASGLAAGIYTFDHIISGLGICPNDTAEFTVTVEQEVTAGADNATAICNSAGNTVDVNTLLSGHDAGGFFEEVTGSGSFAAGTGVLSVGGLTGMDYIIEYIVPGTSPCPNDTAQFTVTVNENPVVSAGFDQVLCEEDAETSVFGAGAGVGGTYVWDNGVTNATPFTPAVGTTIYTVTGTDANGCVGTDNMSITVNPTPIVDILVDTTLGCTEFDVMFTSSSTPASMECTWNFGDGNTSLACGTVMNTYINEGIYTVSLDVVSVDGCVNSITYADLIDVRAHPIAAFQALPNQLIVGETVSDMDNNSLNSSSYYWEFGDGTNSPEENPTHEFPIDAGGIDYNVTLWASNDIGCVDSVSNVVSVQDIILFYVPNTFTPDGDQFNETWAPVFTQGIDIYDFHLVIFNRWGEIVFETYNPNFEWNGTYGDQGLVEDGIYIWQLDFKETMSDKRHKHGGHVTIMK